MAKKNNIIKSVHAYGVANLKEWLKQWQTRNLKVEFKWHKKERKLLTERHESIVLYMTYKQWKFKWMNKELPISITIVIIILLFTNTCSPYIQHRDRWKEGVILHKGVVFFFQAVLFSLNFTCYTDVCGWWKPCMLKSRFLSGTSYMCAAGSSLWQLQLQKNFFHAATVFDDRIQLVEHTPIAKSMR